ncbi:hypothetical protein [Tychonema sp. LEGE 07203]|uniref:hypothetical protein n=1 Tax=Tychonema sp. LEGE 07203 TaxID=1828671 RepID=UPI001881627A|nr:hypothetical protein [Tychonema sp. LEGE 07203]MBE9095438.1 hypothetical protein [Tychonema sp. LEGE 07203]
MPDAVNRAAILAVDGCIQYLLALWFSDETKHKGNKQYWVKHPIFCTNTYSFFSSRLCIKIDVPRLNSITIGKLLRHTFV